MKIGIVTKCKDEFKNSSNPDIMPLCYAMLCYAMLCGALYQIFQLFCFNIYVGVQTKKV